VIALSDKCIQSKVINTQQDAFNQNSHRHAGCKAITEGSFNSLFNKCYFVHYSRKMK